MATKHTDEAIRFLDYYLDDNVEAEFAVMLSAPWGSGKTHFIKKYLDERSARNGDEQGPCYLYASLYGITSTSAINEQFFAQIHPHLSTKATRVIGSVASHWVDKLIGTNGSDQLLRDMLLKLEGKVLVIDDLERCSMKIADVMGFINTFVEHEGLKVIILVNETDIPPDQRTVYDRQKEKLVGKTIQVQSDPEEVLEKLSERFKLGPVKGIVSKEKSALLKTFSASGKSNFRNLRAVLADYERLVEAVDVRLREKPEALKQLLLYMVATCNELRSATVSEDMLRQLPTASFAAVRMVSGSAKQPSEKLFDQLSSRYPEVKWTDPIVSPKLLAELFTSGIINLEEINKGLGQHPEVVGHANAPAWRLLWDWSQLSNTEYTKAKADLLLELSEYKLTHPGVILHVAGIVITLRGFGEQLLGDGVEPKAYFTEYVAILVEENKLVPDKGAFGFDGMVAVGLGYSSAENDDFRAINAMVKEAADTVQCRHMEYVAISYASRLQLNSDSYPSLYEYGVHEENYGSVPFLHHIDVSVFGHLLIADSRSNDHLFASLLKRYEQDYQRGGKLRDEYDWLEELKQHLSEVADADVAPFREVLCRRLEYYFKKIDEGIGRSSV